MAVNALGGKAVSLSGAPAGIVTDGVHTKAKISIFTTANQRTAGRGFIVIVAVSRDKARRARLRTFGRGGRI